MRELVPFALQGVLLALDEFFCHRRRVLRRWERAGHPLDTFVFLLCLLYLLWAPAQEINLYSYGCLCVASCLLISKDEWEHRDLCTGFENWLHAMLFMLHPVVLIWAGYLWWNGHENFRFTVSTASAVASLFLVYQIVFWNVWRRS